MSMARRQFLQLGGFDEALISAEDQDLALRHSEAGGTIVFLPEAVGIHRDEALDVRSYCRRVEWGSRHIVAFCRKHPAWPDNIAREQVNGPLRWAREPMAQSVRKAGKRLAGLRPILELLFAGAAVVERVAPGSPVLERIYRVLLGVHIYRGFRYGASHSMRRKPAVIPGLSPKCG
jgi:GT2 family glycosyltransferase